jgi:uncharacterized membrane-anchored protein YhcB (DUF1043 family)
MWREIEARLDGHDEGVIPLRRAHRRTRWWLAIAAALVIGLGIGRLSMVLAPTSPDAEAVAESTSDPASAASLYTSAYRPATLEHLGRSESLLSLVKADVSGVSGAPAIGSTARSLLTRTRLLLQTPAAREPELRTLLEDLELMLMQVVVTSETEDPREAGFVGESLEGSNLLLRLRSATTREIGPARGL